LFSKIIAMLKLNVHTFALSSDLAFFALILENTQKYHRCEGKGVDDIFLITAACLSRRL